ncbi:MAG: alanine--tRNA ligase [Holosporaceae bacterium]|jgi:alanyl-tRNA synthetase|nr:alanine--tRNA ligase [Holosporaceae bacterium]
MLTADIRSAFLDFFASNAHLIMPSSPVVPHGDSSLLFVNAGMVQFKNIFMGLEIPNFPKVATAQKCIRAGGKHNDLDQVGFTARHHTFFEMLGNFSFGYYFKEEAIYYAWTFITKELGIPRDKLLVTVHKSDEEAKGLWRKIAGDLTVIPIATSDNFWSMGDVGPCGPCSEIFYDHGNKISGGMPGTSDENGDRYVEIWNIVFMQFEKKSNGELTKLRNKSIDTGMGIERIAAVMQGVHDNYDTDIFKKIISAIENISGTKKSAESHSHRVIADHIRAISFLISDGVIPSNEGRGYVLRRIIRRAMRHGNLLGMKTPFLFELPSFVAGIMEDAYPELRKAQSTIASIVMLEEEKFLDTLDRGLKILRQEIEKLPSGGLLGGDIAFKLYDTYGFPLDLTQDVLKINGMTVDLAGFDAALEDQRNRAKWTGSGMQKEEELWLSLKEKLKPTEFAGYERTSCSSRVVVIIQNEKEISRLSSGKAQLVVEMTPFYAESGGQCGDSGEIKTASGLFKVTNTAKFCDAIIAHEGELIAGSMSISDDVELCVDKRRRRKITANHSATHLLQAALRQVLGNHVAQRGSHLDDHGLRFDFSHNSAVSEENLRKIEDMVNGWIIDDLTTYIRVLPRNEAITSGATALFGEKYGDFVRTVRFCNAASKEISFELCGGTHVSNSSEVGIFKILSEIGIGSGVRRIEALTGTGVLHYLTEQETLLRQSSELLKCTSEELPTKISLLSSELKKKNQEIAASKRRHALASINIIKKSDITMRFAILDDYSMEELRSSIETIGSTDQDVCVLLSRDHTANRIHALVTVGKNLKDKYNASVLLKAGLGVIEGKGGGTAVCAQGSGGNIRRADDVLEAILRAIA